MGVIDIYKFWYVITITSPLPKTTSTDMTTLMDMRKHGVFIKAAGHAERRVTVVGASTQAAIGPHCT